MVMETAYLVKCVVYGTTLVTDIWLSVGQMKHLVLISEVGCRWSDVSACLLESLHDAEEIVDVCETMETSFIHSTHTHTYTYTLIHISKWLNRRPDS